MENKLSSWGPPDVPFCNFEATDQAVSEMKIWPKNMNQKKKWIRRIKKTDDTMKGGTAELSASTLTTTELYITNIISRYYA